MTPSLGYVLQAFPQLSETFIENERMALASMGIPAQVYSIFRPAPERAGPTEIDPAAVHYVPGHATLARHFAWWALRRPLVTLAGLVRALRSRSKVMLRGLWWAAWLASGLRRDGITHVHAHFGTEPACAGLPAARLAGLPFSFTIHARDIYLRNRGLDLRVNDADAVVTVCEYNVEQLLARFPGLRADQFDLIYCGVDTSAFLCSPPNDAGGPTRLLSVGRLVEKKGFQDLIRAVGLLRGDGHDVVCEIVGHGELAPTLEALVAELGLEDSVALTGAMSPTEVAGRVAACDIFVLACRIDDTGDRDSMPVVLKEAMASCRPVVSTTTVGIPELVDEEVGVLVEPDDPASLAAGIEQLIGLGADRLIAMGHAGRQRVEEQFNLVTETTKLKAVLERLG